MGRILKRAVLLDTGIWAQTLIRDSNLSYDARSVIANASAIFVSPISVYEIGQKCRLGKWDEMKPHVDKLPNILSEQGGQWASLSAEIFLQASSMDWEHRDPFDRIIVSTAKQQGFHLITTDQAISKFLGSEQVTN